MKSTYSLIFYFVYPSQLIRIFSTIRLSYSKNLLKWTNLANFSGSTFSFYSSVTKPGIAAMQSTQKSHLRYSSLSYFISDSFWLAFSLKKFMIISIVKQTSVNSSSTTMLSEAAGKTRTKGVANIA
jgi:hypothetical protein